MARIPASHPHTSRRRFLAVAAAAAGLPLLPFGSADAATHGTLVTWRGVALGAVATLQVHHPDRATAERLVRAAVAETARLEAIFSLYRTDSVLSELNRTGVVIAPPTELVDLLAACDAMVRATGGVFDPTVQPLWACHAAHFSARGRDAGPPPADALRDALARVGWDKVRFGRDRVAFATRGMALTLNGIAQGFVTDRVVARLRDAGLAHAMVDMGEIFALGDHPGGRPWQAALERSATRAPDVVPLVDRAVATSAAAGFAFDADGRCNHLFDPRTGRCAAPARRITVVAATATTADALSTAFSLMDDAVMAETARRSAVELYPWRGE